MLNYILFTLYLGGLFVLIFKGNFFKNIPVNKYVLLTIFVLKLSAGIGLNILYSSYYTDTSQSDIHKYVDDGIALKNLAYEDVSLFLNMMAGTGDDAFLSSAHSETLKNWNPHKGEYLEVTGYKDSNFIQSQRFLIRLNALIAFISNGFLPIHTLFICFLSFWGGLLFFKTCIHIAPDKKMQLLAASFLIPSVLLWSSGILKESMLIWGLGLITYAAFSPSEKRYKILAFVGGFFILLFNSMHVLALFFFGLMIYFAFIKYRTKALIIPVFLFLITVCVHYLVPEKSPFAYLSSKQNYQQQIGRGGYYFFNTADKSFQICVSESEMEYALQSGNAFSAEQTLYYLSPTVEYSLYGTGKVSEIKLPLDTYSGEYYLMFHFPRAGSYINGPPLFPEPAGWISYLPTAIKNVFWEPIGLANKNPLLWLTSIENALVILLLLFYFSNKTSFKNIDAFSIFLFSFSLGFFLLIGYTDVIAGNILRHKAPALLFLAAACVISFDKKN